MKEWKTRQLSINQYDDIINLWKKAGLPFRPRGRDSRAHIAQEMEGTDTAFIGIFDNNKLVAAGLATYDGRKGWINRVAVDPDYRGRGLAGKIITACEQFLEGIGAEIIACLIEDYNKPSMALFQKHGYILGKDILYFSRRKSPDI